MADSMVSAVMDIPKYIIKIIGKMIYKFFAIIPDWVTFAFSLLFMFIAYKCLRWLYKNKDEWRGREY